MVTDDPNTGEIVLYDEYSSAIKESQFISAVRVVTGHMLGRFKNLSE
jgi:hypothetical protein